VALRRSNERLTGSRVTEPIAMLEFPAVDATQRIQSKAGDRARQTLQLKAHLLAVGPLDIEKFCKWTIRASCSDIRSKGYPVFQQRYK
jgi:hypothetical protein